MINQTYSLKGEGFGVLFPSDGWRVARSGYNAGKNDMDQLTGMGRHMETDETFLLVGGNAVMITAGFDDEIGEPEVYALKPEELFVVRRGEWHQIRFAPGGLAFVVENADVGKSMNADFTEGQIIIIKEKIKALGF